MPGDGGHKHPDVHVQNHCLNVTCFVPSQGHVGGLFVLWARTGEPWNAARQSSKSVAFQAGALDGHVDTCENDEPSQL